MALPAPVEDALTFVLSGLTAVDGTRLVRDQVRTGALDDWFEDRHHPKPIHVLAIGKAAPAMLWGLVEASVPFSGVGVAPRQRTRPTVDTFTWHDGDHPVPGPASFAAGKAIQDWCNQFPEGGHLLVLLSGGSSSLLEVPRDGDEKAAVAAWEEDLRAGLTIEAMNERRTARSALKGGRLGRLLAKRTPHVRVWVLADTPPETAAAVVGSAPFWTGPSGFLHGMLASNERLVEATGSAAAAGYIPYAYPTRLGGDTTKQAAAFVESFRSLSEPGAMLLGGGETTQALPRDAPPGGRCQHAALAAAQHLQDGEMFLALGSDGVDGSTKEAGAWSDAETWNDDRDAAATALAELDAHRFLDGRRQTLRIGNTRTHVNDIWLLMRPKA